MSRVYWHVTTRKALPAIRKDGGLRGTSGVCGFAVYLWDDLEHAEDYMEDVDDPVLIRVESYDPDPCDDPPEEEGDEEMYNHVFLVRLKRKGVWVPERLQILK